MPRATPAILLLVVGVTIPAAAQPPQATADEAAILAVVDRFMVAVSTNDATALSALRVEGGFNTVERPADGGGTLVTRRTFAPTTAKPGNYRERFWDPVVHVRGNIAVVWTP